MEKGNNVRLFKIGLNEESIRSFFKNTNRVGKAFWKQQFSQFIFHLMITKSSYFVIPGLGTVVEPLL